MIIGYLLAPAPLEELPKGNFLAEGKVIGIVSKQRTPTQFVYVVNRLNNKYIEPIKLRVTCENLCMTMKGGQHWRLLMRIKPPVATYNPHSFDSERWLMAQGLQGFGYVKPSNHNSLLNQHSKQLSYRQLIYDQIITSFPYTETSSSLAALLLGYRSDLTSEQRDRLRESGLSHLIAISGLHVSLAMFPGILMGSFVWLIIWNRVRIRKQSTQMLIGLATATIYALMSGFEQPAQRALFMLVILTILSLGASRASGIQRLLVAIVVMLLIEPQSMIDISFWLTVVVTAVILLGLHVKAHSRINSIVYLQLLLCVVVSAFQLMLFSEYSLTSFSQNLWAIPFISLLIIPLGFLWLVVSQLSELFVQLDYIETMIASILDYLVYLFWYVLETIAQFKQKQFQSMLVWRSHVSFLQFLPLMIALMLVWLTGLRYSAVPSIVMVTILLTFTVKRKGLILTAFDVGQGTAIAIEVDDKLLLYDSGYRHDDWVKIAAILPPWLLANDYKHFNYYIESHSDIDHSGGTEWLLANYRVDTVLHSHSSSQMSFLNRAQCRPDVNYLMGTAEVTILSPPQDNQWADNDRSCVVLIDYAGKKILLTGDIESTGEQWLVSNYPWLRADIVLVPHHGSKTSSSWPLLSMLRPSIAINTSGYDNRFSFPHDEIVNRYQQIGSALYDTATHGQIKVFIQQSGEINIHSTRQQNPALWRRN